MLYLERLFHLDFICFAVIHEIFDVVPHLRLIYSTFFIDDVYLHVLIDILLWIQFGAIGRQEKDFYPFLIPCKPLVKHLSLVRWMPVRCLLLYALPCFRNSTTK